MAQSRVVFHEGNEYAPVLASNPTHATVVGVEQQELNFAAVFSCEARKYELASWWLQ